MKTYDYLLSFKVKPSVQRLAIMDYLLTHRTHPSIEEIYMALCDDIPTLSKTTVYNTLKLFVDAGLISMLTIDDTFRCFDGNTSAHAHFRCNACGKIVDLELDNNFLSVVKGLEGYKVSEAQLYLKGLCTDCKD